MQSLRWKVLLRAVVRFQCERVKPWPRRERFGSQAAELSELRDHVRLVGIPQPRRHLRPLHIGPCSDVNKPAAEAR